MMAFARVPALRQPIPSQCHSDVAHTHLNSMRRRALSQSFVISRRSLPRQSSNAFHASTSSSSTSSSLTSSTCVLFSIVVVGAVIVFNFIFVLIVRSGETDHGSRMQAAICERKDLILMRVMRVYPKCDPSAPSNKSDHRTVCTSRVDRG
mmetsp:Transcript_2293/g.6214  ORF Transcript_2293/g.6214 Transcript_2293/m.6214 type:complete len:150 (+) Transcript_2293:1344-1793(+)